MTPSLAPPPALWTARALVAAGVAACGSLGGDGGGGENLPNRGIIPYAYRAVDDGSGAPDEVPYVIEDPDGAQLGEPFAERTDDGMRLWVERRSRDGDEIGTFVSRDGVTFDPAYTPILTPAAFSELAQVDAADIGAPSVLTIDETRWLALDYDDGEGIALVALDATPPSVWTATATDHGFDALSSPSIARAPTDGGLLLFATAVRDGRDAVIVSATRAGDGFSLFVDAVPSGAPCLDAEGSEIGCWDAFGAGSPDVRRARTGAGRPYLRMFFAGGGDLDDALGFAASFDGRTWDRYAFNPIFDEGRTAISAPSALRLDDAWLLYFERRTARAGGIALAVNAKPWMADQLAD